MDHPTDSSPSQGMGSYKKALWKQLQSTKWIRQMAHNVCRALPKSVIHRPLLMVLVPGPMSRTWQEYHQKVELEKACLEEAGWRFTQAQHTPLLSTPLINIFGEYGNSKEVAKVLAGNLIPPPQCDLYAAKFLLAVSQPQCLEEWHPDQIQHIVVAGKKQQKQLAHWLWGFTLGTT